MFDAVSGLMIGSYIVVNVICVGILIRNANHHLEDM